MTTKQEKLQTLLDKDLKRLEYINSKNIKDFNKIHYQLLLKSDEKSVLVYILNSHNCYFHREIAMYREVCKNLIDIGYQITMQYPCYITVTHRVFEGISKEEDYYYSD